MRTELRLYKNGEEVDSYKDYYALKGLFYDLTGEELTESQIDEKIYQLSKNEQLMGMMWGWSDTEFRDMVYIKYRNQLK